MARFPTGRSNSKLTAEERRLQREAEELRRKEEELQKQLRILPAQLEARKTQARKLAKLRAETSARAIHLSGTRTATSPRRSGKHRPLPARELHNARIKFVVLCLILLTIGILLWRALP